MKKSWFLRFMSRVETVVVSYRRKVQVKEQRKASEKEHARKLALEAKEYAEYHLKEVEEQKRQEQLRHDAAVRRLVKVAQQKKLALAKEHLAEQKRQKALKKKARMLRKKRWQRALKHFKENLKAPFLRWVKLWKDKTLEKARMQRLREKEALRLETLRLREERRARFLAEKEHRRTVREVLKRAQDEDRKEREEALRRERALQHKASVTRKALAMHRKHEQQLLKEVQGLQRLLSQMDQRDLKLEKKLGKALTVQEQRQLLQRQAGQEEKDMKLLEQKMESLAKARMRG